MKKNDKPSAKPAHGPLPPPPPRPWQSASFSFSKTHKPKDRQGLSKQLEAIYFSPQGEPAQDMGRLDHKPRRRALRLMGSIAAILLVVGGVAWAGLLVWNPFSAGQASGLEVVITGPEKVTLGEDVAYVVEYANHGTRSLSDVVLRLGLPNGFDLAEGVPPPTDTSQRLWTIGPLAIGGSGRIQVKGRVMGGLGEASALQVLGTYRVEGSRTDQTLVVTQAMTYTDTVLRAESATPTVVVAGEPVTVAFQVRNRGLKTLGALVARIELPRQFVPAGQSSSSQGLVYVDLPLVALEAGATSSLSVLGSFTAGVSGEQGFRLRVGRAGENGAFLSMLDQEQRVPVLAGDLSLNVVVNGSDVDRSIKPGESIHLAIGYQNVSPEALKDVVITVALESFLNEVSATGTSLLNWDGAESEPPAVSSTKPRIQTLTFDATSIPSFQSLAPQEQGVIEVTLPTLEAPSGTQQAVVRLAVEATLKGVGKAAVKRKLQTRPLSLAYRTDAQLTVQARAFTEEGAPLGSGPLPPVAGETTAYRIFWRVEKSLHALDGLEVRATLPGIAKWTGKAEAGAGNLSYDEGTRTVRWSLNTLPENVDMMEANFEVQLTPDAFDIGRFAQLLSETRLEARDPQVNEPLLLSRPGLSTDLNEDEAARGKGVVRAAIN
jgi:hypothetical protein